MNPPIRVGIVGIGKIACDEHVPAIARTDGVELVATASRHGRVEGVPGYRDQSAMLAAHPEIDAVVLCQPPVVRFDSARRALLAGRHVFLEKPPGVTVGEAEQLAALARERGLALFASWHSRWSAGVDAVLAWCAARTPTHVTVEWKEDVRRWHPGQAWIWEPGGFGVFDPGLNALSIITAALRQPLRVTHASLAFPQNRAAPIAATLSLESPSGTAVDVDFDWRQTGPQTWRIAFEAADEVYEFAQGGDDAASAEPTAESALAAEYRAMYRHFVRLVREREIDVDTAPLQIVADAFLRGRLETVAPFHD
jgi:D-galactose 1-dehydrogenase